MMALPVVNTYPLSNYTYDMKEPKILKDASPIEYRNRLKANYMRDGMRTSVEGILLAHKQNHPHILLLKLINNFYKLPGGCLELGETEIEGLQRKLSSKLAAPGFEPDWEIGECVAMWWRPNFHSMIFYPYCPLRITQPKECKKLFLVHLSEREYFQVPNNYTLVAVPLFELYDNAQMDRASILGDAIDYLKELLQRINDLHNELEATPPSSLITPTSSFHPLTPTPPTLPHRVKEELCPSALPSPKNPSARVEVRAREGRAVNIHMFCARRPGLLLSTLRALDNLGLDIQQAVISCFNGFALDVFRAEQCREGQEVLPEQIKAVLLDSAGFHGAM